MVIGYDLIGKKITINPYVQLKSMQSPRESEPILGIVDPEVEK